MGAWGTGIYDNDAAADWAAELEKRGLAAITDALDAVINAEYLDAWEGTCGLAAADAVARLRSGGGEATAYSEGVTNWVAQNHASPSDDLIAKARSALGKVRH